MLALRSVRRPKPTCTGFVAACTVPNMPQSINNISIYIYICMSVCLCVCIFLCLYVCMSVCLYGCMAVWLYGCMSVCLYVCMYVYVCVCMAYIHTYIHTYNIYIYIFMCIFMFIYHTLALSLKLRRPRQAMCLAGSSCLTVATAGLTSRMKDASFCALNVFGDAAFDDSALALAMCHVSRTALN